MVLWTQKEKQKEGGEEGPQLLTCAFLTSLLLSTDHRISVAPQTRGDINENCAHSSVNGYRLGVFLREAVFHPCVVKCR